MLIERKRYAGKKRPFQTMENADRICCVGGCCCRLAVGTLSSPPSPSSPSGPSVFPLPPPTPPPSFLSKCMPSLVCLPFGSLLGITRTRLPRWHRGGLRTKPPLPSRTSPFTLATSSCTWECAPVHHPHVPENTDGCFFRWWEIRQDKSAHQRPLNRRQQPAVSSPFC